jgi:hypothetical protein
MSVRESTIRAGGVKIDVPEAGTGITFANDGGDAGDNGADVVLVEKDVVTTVVAELTEGEECLARQGRVYGGLASGGRQRDRDVGKVQGGVVGCGHDVAVGEPNTEAMLGRSFVGAGAG